MLLLHADDLSFNTLLKEEVTVIVASVIKTQEYASLPSV